MYWFLSVYLLMWYQLYSKHTLYDFNRANKQNSFHIAHCSRRTNSFSELSFQKAHGMNT